MDWLAKAAATGVAIGELFRAQPFSWSFGVRVERGKGGAEAHTLSGAADAKSPGGDRRS